MSRPFSYNDENFTVIGNLLIIHVAYSGEIKLNDIICNVPEGISKRLKYFSFIGCYNKSPFSPTPDVSLFVRDGKLRVTNAGTYKDGEFFLLLT